MFFVGIIHMLRVCFSLIVINKIIRMDFISFFMYRIDKNVTYYFIKILINNYLFVTTTNK